MENKSMIRTVIAGAAILLVAVIVAATLNAAPQNSTLANGRGFYPVLGRTAGDWSKTIPLGVARLDFLIKDKYHPKKGYGRLQYDIQLDGDKFPILNVVGKIETKSGLPQGQPLSMDFSGSVVISGLHDSDQDDTYSFTAIIDDGDPGVMPDHFMITMAGGSKIILDPIRELSVDGGQTIRISNGDFVFINNGTVVVGIDPGDNSIVDNDDAGWSFGIEDGQHSIIIDGGDTVTIDGNPLVGIEPIIVDGGNTIEVSIEGVGPAKGDLIVAGTEALSVDGGDNWIVAQRDIILLGANQGDLIRGDIFIRAK